MLQIYFQYIHTHLPSTSFPSFLISTYSTMDLLYPSIQLSVYSCIHISIYSSVRLFMGGGGVLLYDSPYHPNLPNLPILMYLPIRERRRSSAV